MHAFLQRRLAAARSLAFLLLIATAPSLQATQVLARFKNPFAHRVTIRYRLTGASKVIDPGDVYEFEADPANFLDAYLHDLYLYGDRAALGERTSFQVRVRATGAGPLMVALALGEAEDAPAGRAQVSWPQAVPLWSIKGLLLLRGACTQGKASAQGRAPGRGDGR